MKLTRGVLVSLCILLCAVCSATAQLSVYGTVATTNYGYAYNNDSLTFTGEHVGFGFGAFYNFPIQSRLTAGIDARFSDTPNARGGNNGFVSARFGFVPHHNPLRPYVQIGGGYVHTKVPGYSIFIGPQPLTTGALGLAFGLDVRINPSLDWRAIELAAGAGSKNSTSAGAGALSTGIVYHFHS